MKTIQKVLIIFSLMLSFQSINAQDRSNPWLVSVGFNAVGLQGDLIGSASLSESDYKSMSFGVPSLSVFRSIYGGLSLGAQFSFNSLKSETNVSDAKFSTIEGALKYGFARDSKVSPFLKAGFGRTSFGIGSDDGFNAATNATDTYFGGAGLSFKLGDKFDAFVESSYRSTQDAPEGNYFQHVFGVALKFGGVDTDGDGVYDKNDECPDVPGLEEFAGCPDSDGDGIADKIDACPDKAGTVEMNGCPDTDGDGISDIEDACPDQAGTVEMNGCPDSDKDGINDKDDTCPNEPGPIENNGCPWGDMDRDGVPDKDDACPSLGGSASNNGCPEIPEDIISELLSESSMIQFMASSSVIKGEESKGVLNKIKTILESYPKSEIIVEGYASSDGSKAYNQKLSEARAASVKEALTALGAVGSRISTIGYGEDKPIGDNKRAAGRKINRRVQFSVSKK
jgi:outer membrane protein OmpA-like peptidoglycan-associated protein